MADVGTDIFGILNTYLTSRQGPLDGKKPPPQGPTPEGPPVPPPAAPPPPEPPAGMAPNVAPPAPAPGPPIPTDTRTLAADGGLAQYTAMLKASQEAQRKAAFGSALARGGASLGAALTRSPSMRESLTSIAGHGGGGGDGSGGGVGNLTPDAFLKFGERADSLAAKGRFAASRGALSKQLGISESALQTMYDTDPKKVADLQAANADPTREVKVLDDGTIMSTRKNAAPGEKPIVLGYDTEKQAEGKRKDITLGLAGEKQRLETEAAPGQRAKTAAETAEAGARTTKLDEENLRGKELRTIMTDPVMRKHLADTLGTDEGSLYTAFTSGKSDEVIANNIKSTPLYQDWLKTDRSKTFTEFFKDEQLAKSLTPAPGRAFAESESKRITGLAERADVARGTLPDTRRQFDILAKGEGMVGGLIGKAGVQQFLNTASTFFAVPPDKMDAIIKSQELSNLAKDRASKRAKELGVNPTDLDFKNMEQLSGGNLEQQRAALLSLSSMNVRHEVQSIINSTTAATKAQESELFKNDPAAMAYLKGVNQNIPDHTAAMFPAKEIAAMVAAAKSDASDADKKATYDVFDARYGPGMANYLLTKRGAI